MIMLSGCQHFPLDLRSQQVAQKEAPLLTAGSNHMNRITNKAYSSSNAHIFAAMSGKSLNPVLF